MDKEQELINACKRGLGLSTSTSSDDLDGGISQKIFAVQGYMQGAGVSAEALTTELGIGATALGVADIWNIEGGTMKFSPVFLMFVTQLAARGSGVSEV